jgi:Ras-related GTP-binding protein C/D
MDFQVWDFPGQLDYFDPTFDPDSIFGEIGALIWVIDAQDDYLDAIARLNATIMNLQQSYPSINVEVFIHKVDALSIEFRSETFQDIVQRISDELSDAGYENAPVSYYMTSIYDLSIFEAFSKVIQKLIPQLLPTLESLLNILTANTGMEKAYLFDVLSKIYIASDASPVDMASYEMCSDYVDVIVDMSELYAWERPNTLSDEEFEKIQLPEAEAHVKIHNDSLIYLKEMNRYLALVSVIKRPEAKQKIGLINYIVEIVQEALNDVFARGWEVESGNGAGATA